MNRFYIAGTLLCCALFLAILAPSAYSDEWNKMTVVTFPNPVEVPGAVLQPGKYVLKLVDSPSDRHIVQITNERQDHIYATILAIPNYRLEPRGKTVVTFYEMPSGQPEALKAWFYPGDNYGQEFTYSKDRARLISEATHENVPVTPPDSHVSTATQQPSAVESETTPTTPRSEETSPSPQSPPQAEPRTEPVGQSVEQDRVERRVAEDDVEPAVGGGVVPLHRPDVFQHRGDHRSLLERKRRPRPQVAGVTLFLEHRARPSAVR